MQNESSITKRGITCLTNLDLHYLVDNNTFSATCKNLNDLLYIFKKRQNRITTLVELSHDS